VLTAQRGLHVVRGSDAQLDEDLPQSRHLTLAKSLLGKSLLELVGSESARLDEIDAERRITLRLVAYQPEHPHEIERAERFHDEGRRSDGARERAALGIVARGKEDHARGLGPWL
jgi:hypothetical protein